MATLTATCHCGAVRIDTPRPPRTLTDCNCSICRRYGALWAYYEVGEAQVAAESGALEEYEWGDRSLRFFRCAHCGCVTHWLPTQPAPGAKMGVNARNFAPGALPELPVRRLDGASTWTYLDEPFA